MIHFLTLKNKKAKKAHPSPYKNSKAVPILSPSIPFHDCPTKIKDPSKAKPPQVVPSNHRRRKPGHVKPRLGKPSSGTS
jgi:hypothetical protein